MRKKKLQYWFKSQLSNAFIDVTSNVTKHIQGSEKINDLPGSFKFSLSPTKKNGQLRPIFDSNLDINTGDIFLITIDLIEIVAYGAVLDSGRDIVTFDYQLNQVIPKFDITCIQPNFSSTDIEKIEYLSAISFSTLLDNILSYANEDFGAAGIGKYKLNIDDFDVNSFSSENKDSRQMLTESCDQNNLFWVMKYILYTENSVPIKIERYVEISNKSGIIPSIDSTFYNGIDNNNARRGYTKDANNNFLSIDNNFKPRKDISVIINKLSLICKVPFYDDSSEKLYRYNRAALPNTFDYELDGYASEIKYIAFALQDPKFPVKCLSGSNSSSVKIPSRFAVNINVNDIAYFKDNNPDGFYKITSVTRVNDTYTTIGFSPSLPFTPSTSDSFEIAGNVPIFTSEKDLDYSSHGALVDCNIKNNGKVKFLDLSEPPPGTFISIFYKRVKDFEFIVKNDDSIKNPAVGLRYKQIRIDDTVTFTKDELDNLSSKLLVLKPKFDFSFNTYRKGLAQIGLTMSVNIDNFVKEAFILNEMSYSFMGNYDSDGYPLFDQNLTFSTEVSDPQKVLDRYIKIKQKASTTKESLEKNKQIEEVQLIENILWDFKRLGINAPTALSSSGITSNHFYANWSNTTDPSLSYDTLDVSLYNDFRNFIDGYNNHGVGLKTTELVNGPEITANDIFYYRLRSFNKSNIPSEFSNIITVNKSSSGSFPSLSRMSAYLKFEEASGNTCIDEKSNVTANLWAYDGTSYPSRVGTSPNRGVSFIDNSAVRVVDNTNIKSVNGGTFLFRLKRTTSPSASQTLALKVTDYHSSAPTQSDYAFLIGTDNKLYAEYSTPQFTASKEFILFESAVMSIPSNGIYCLGFSYNPALHQFKIVFNNSEITWSVNTASYRYYSNINDVDYLVNSAISDLFLGNYVYGSISQFIVNSLKLTDELLDFAFCKDEYFTVNEMKSEFTGLYDI